MMTISQSEKLNKNNINVERRQADITLNLEAVGNEQILIKNYLQENASDVLADKINNGVRIEKEGVSLVNRKTLSSFMNYASKQAHEGAGTGTNFACVTSDTVFGWAVHYFEEDSIEGVLYNPDGTEYKPAKTVSTRAETKSVPTGKVTVSEPRVQKMDMFGIIKEKTLEDFNIESDTASCCRLI